jgi:hypothetical protein
LFGITEVIDDGTSTSLPPTVAYLPGVNCTLPSITEFPPDLFTLAERREGWLAVHFLASVYVFYVLALVCDEYFVPSIEAICDGTTANHTSISNVLSVSLLFL